MERNNEDAPLLVAQAGPLNGQRWSLRGKVIIGRESTCDIVIADRQVSRHHARISQTPNGIILEDLDSKNGTHRNGKPLDEPVFLEDGDVLQIALAQQFVYLSSDATLPLNAGGMEQPTPKTGLLYIEKRSRRVWIADDEVLPPLSAAQYALLDKLYEQQGRVVTRADLIRTIWGDEQAVTVSEQALDALVRRLRERLAEIDPNHQYIITVRGHGLRLDNPQQEE
ncbi:MAG: FHA domain-containing protein [Anaerolineales bacterium]